MMNERLTSAVQKHEIRFQLLIELHTFLGFMENIQIRKYILILRIFKYQHNNLIYF